MLDYVKRILKNRSGLSLGAALLLAGTSTSLAFNLLIRKQSCHLGD